MPARLSSALIHAVLNAYVSSPTWHQAALARHIGIPVPGLIRALQELQSVGFPLERVGESPDVTWSLPESWLPGSFSVEDEELPVLVDALMKTSASPARNNLLRRVLSGGSVEAPVSERGAELDSVPPLDDALRALLMEAHAKKIPVRIQYASSRPVEGARTLSIQELKFGSSTMFTAYCHRTQGLKAFRADNVISASLRPAEEFIPVSKQELQAFTVKRTDSLELEPIQQLAFRVQFPQARWVKNSLPLGMTIDEAGSSDEYLRVLSKGGAPTVARYIAGLGGIAQAEGEALRGLVREIAASALSEHESIT